MEDEEKIGGTNKWIVRRQGTQVQMKQIKRREKEEEEKIPLSYSLILLCATTTADCIPTDVS